MKSILARRWVPDGMHDRARNLTYFLGRNGVGHVPHLLFKETEHRTTLGSGRDLVTIDQSAA